MTVGRRRALIFSTIILFGIGAGFFLRSEWDRREFAQVLQGLGGDPAETMAFLFEKFCLGELRGHRLNPQGLLKPIFFSGQNGWLEEKTRLRVHLDLFPPKTCSVADDVDQLSEVERNRLRGIVEARIWHWTPELTKIEPKTNEFFRFDAWTTLEEDEYLRWGIMLYQLEEFGQRAFTYLVIGIPSPEQFERRLAP